MYKIAHCSLQKIINTFLHVNNSSTRINVIHSKMSKCLLTNKNKQKPHCDLHKGPNDTNQSLTDF